jgi:mannose-1-phosphate guanylyltransferase/mannose-6-phosphate isomerase
MNLLSHHFTEERPWGSFEDFTLNEQTTVKILRVAAGKRFSLQKHTHRSEYWKVIEGSGIAQVDDTEWQVKTGDEIQIHQGSLHRLTGGENAIAVLEISFGEFDENDIERVADDFGRAGVTNT